MDWKQLLAYITGSVEEELLLRNEYLVAENRILRDQIKSQPGPTQRHRASDLGRDRQEAQQTGTGRSRQHCQTRYDPGMASKVGCPEV